MCNLKQTKSLDLSLYKYKGQRNKLNDIIRKQSDKFKYETYFISNWAGLFKKSMSFLTGGVMMREVFENKKD